MRVRLVVVGALLLSACQAAQPATDGRAVGERPPSPAHAISAARPSPAPKLRGTYAAIPARSDLPMWKTPAASGVADFTFDARDPFGRIAPLLVDGVTVDSSGRVWYRLLLPIRPNGSAAWVPREEVLLVRRNGRIVVSLSQRTLRYFVGNHVAARFAVGIGTPLTPTATGKFYVWVRVSYPGPNGPYGVFALGLSGFSPVLKYWPGGGRLAIHGTANPDDRGRRVSHGCVRVYNPEMLALQSVPLGTPVIIKS
jgi:lipoprotein-anchoring transpeptidase ErfK/SrfK